jgi:hypothetical protein
MLVENRPPSAEHARRLLDLAVTAVEYTRGDVNAAARVLGYDVGWFRTVLRQAAAAGMTIPRRVRREPPAELVELIAQGSPDETPPR